MKELQTNLIGKKMYPVDNSFSKTIGTDKCPYLAGTCSLLAKRVLIVSEPYNLKVIWFNKNFTHSFVTVFYKRKLHIILNSFSNKREKI